MPNPNNAAKAIAAKKRAAKIAANKAKLKALNYDDLPPAKNPTSSEFRPVSKRAGDNLKSFAKGGLIQHD
tara:strand:+ start:257 stop:466 length:210 start_codon:yes stop_codon:yes gene_type:complete